MDPLPAEHGSHRPPATAPEPGTRLRHRLGKAGPAPRTVYEDYWLRKGWARDEAAADDEGYWTYVWRYAPSEAKRQGRRQTLAGLGLLVLLLAAIIVTAIIISGT